VITVYKKQNDIINIKPALEFKSQPFKNPGPIPKVCVKLSGSVILVEIKNIILYILPAFAENRQPQLADECGKGTSAGFAEAGALVPPTSVGGAPLQKRFT
jgi:hypothetical protein